jgi:hypothetical protein
MLSNGQRRIKLGETPSISALWRWLKPATKKSLLDFPVSQQAPRLMEMKGALKSQLPELEEESFEWFEKKKMKKM